MIKLKKIILFQSALLILISSSFGQEQKSIHQIEWERHRDLPTTERLIGDRSNRIIPLQESLKKSTSLNGRVFGFLPYWSTDEYLQYDLLTHIGAFSVEVNETGSLGNDHGWPWVNLINQAHSNGVKVILVATLFDGDKIDGLIDNQTYKNNFFSNIRNKILEGNADGLNVDFESLNPGTRGEKINTFMSELTQYLHDEIPGAEVSFDGPAVNWGGSWDLVGLAQSCDYIFVMGYAFAGSWSEVTGANAPLASGSINITNTVLSQYLFVTLTTPEKLILGVPYYGNHWKSVSGLRGSNVTDHVGSVFFDSAISGAETYGLIWDEPTHTPWYRWNDGSDWHQVWFDDDSSLGLKYDLALENSLGGIGMWALGYDGSRQDLWNMIDLKYGSGQQPPPSRPTALRILGASASSLQVDFAVSPGASGYFIYLSNDGLSFPDSVFMAGPGGTVQNLQQGTLYFIRVKAVNSTGMSGATEVLAGVPSDFPHDILIVNGFDRVSGTNNSLDFIRQHGEAIHHQGRPFSSASNESVFTGQLNLNEFGIVDWILGDESTADDTFNQLEQDRAKQFLENGGSLFVSGAEIGWDLARGSQADQSFYANYLKADYISDAPNGQSGTFYSAEPLSGTFLFGTGQFDFDDGTNGTFNVDWPDAIKGVNGGTECLKYVNFNTASGAAGILFAGMFPQGTAPGKLVHFAIPFETIYPENKRFDIMGKIFDFFETTTAVDEPTFQGPVAFTLAQNYPNPFNPETTISFTIPYPGQVTLGIFNVVGQRIFSMQRSYDQPGQKTLLWNSKNMSGLPVSAGTYLYRVSLVGEDGIRHQRASKMTLLE